MIKFISFDGTPPFGDVFKAIQTQLVYGQKSKLKHGNPLWMLFMPKVVYSSVRLFILEGLTIQVYN